MNKKRKILTVVAMVAFGVIIFFHYCSFDTRAVDQATQRYVETAPYLTTYPGMEDVRMPLFALAVFYAGLFVILGDNKRKEQ